MVRKDFESEHWGTFGDITRRVEAIERLDAHIRSEDKKVFNKNFAFVDSLEKALTQLPRRGDELMNYHHQHTTAVVALAAYPWKRITEGKLAAVLRSVPTLASVSDKELEAVANAMHPKIYPSGSEIVSQGQIGNRLYIIDQGEAEVTAMVHNESAEASHKVFVGRLHEGDVFGEVALLKDEWCNSTVTAVGDCLCLELRRSLWRDATKVVASQVDLTSSVPVINMNFEGNGPLGLLFTANNDGKAPTVLAVVPGSVATKVQNMQPGLMLHSVNGKNEFANDAAWVQAIEKAWKQEHRVQIGFAADSHMLQCDGHEEDETGRSADAQDVEAKLLSGALDGTTLQFGRASLAPLRVQHAAEVKSVALLDGCPLAVAGLADHSISISYAGTGLDEGILSLYGRTPVLVYMENTYHTSICIGKTNRDSGK
jgi:hypothetical protein